MEDLDRNGYPDIFTTFLVKDNTSGKRFHYSTILFNHPCGKNKTYTPCQFFQDSPEYQRVNLLATKRSSMLIPIDIDEEGKIDFYS
jgi:hypothetical protein